VTVGGSWTALVAATTLGLSADALRTEIRADGLDGGRTYRLVVQSYYPAPGQPARRYSRPAGSAQRAVTAEELSRGVHVSLLEMQAPRDGVRVQDRDPLILAWIEAGEPDLEFDGRNARPRPGSVYGVVKRQGHDGVVLVSLTKKVIA
jgi:hypothetical protein